MQRTDAKDNVESSTESKNIAFFSTQPYDKAPFLKQVAIAGLDSEWNIQFHSYSLTPSTAHLCKNTEAVVVFVNDQLDAECIAILHKHGVKHIALRCAGFNNVDVKAALSKGISVSRVPAYSPQSVAEHTLALILTLNRKTHKAYNRVREGNFSLNGLMGFTLHGKTIGIIGTGSIGKAVISILTGFGCNILCYDIIEDKTIVNAGAHYVSLDTLLTESHIISLHCPLNEHTFHIIDSDAINRMPDDVMIINTSRGALVDSKAIIKGLKSKKIGFLGLDVYEQESDLFFSDHSGDVIQDDDFQRLTTFPNVVITGHQGFFTEEALREIASTTVGNIQHYRSTKTGQNNNIVLPDS